jgi:periplasmic protein TonB
MNPNQILSADLLDLVFSDRNKAYGAYELRKSYDSRIKKALGITSLVLLLGVGGHLMARSVTNNRPVTMIEKHVIELSDIPEDIVEPLPPPLPPPVEQPPVRTLQFTTPVIVDEPDQPPPTIAEIENARIDVITTDGVDDPGIVAPSTIDVGKGIIEQQVVKEPEIWTGPVEMEAIFKGDWIRFLERNLNGNVPVDNGAPAGKYTVLIQFVVDTEGKISDIRPLSNNGYGMEDEAIRVLKKANKWDPAIQNGRQVKTYKRQPITFRIDE